MTRIPVVLCDQAPDDDSGPVLLQPGEPCPYCGQPIEAHETDEEAA